MDDEARKISEMSAAELEARWAAAEPAKVSRKPRTDVNTVRIERSFKLDDFYAENLFEWLGANFPLNSKPSIDSCLSATLLSRRMCGYMIDRGHLDWF